MTQPNPPRQPWPTRSPQPDRPVPPPRPTKPPTRLQPGQVELAIWPGETRAGFIARIIATAPIPDAALAEDLRRWFPPAPADVPERNAA